MQQSRDMDIRHGVLVRYTGNSEEVALPAGIQAIGEQAFQNCAGVKAVALPQGVQVVGVRAFEGCTALESVTLPQGVAAIGPSAFQWCSSLASVTIPKSVARIEADAFCHCGALRRVTVLGAPKISPPAFDPSAETSFVDGVGDPWPPCPRGENAKKSDPT